MGTELFNNLCAESNLLDWLVGTNPDYVGEPVFHFANLPESWGWFVFFGIVVAVGVAVFFLYLREINTASVPVKIVMAVLRFSVLLLLIVMLLKPSVFFRQVDEIKPVVSFLRDASLSLNRGDRYQDEDYVKRLAEASGIAEEKIASGEAFRNKILNEVLAKDKNAIIQAIRDRGSISVINFGESVEQVAIIPAFEEKATTKKKDEEEAGDNEDSEAGDSEEPGEDAEDPSVESLVRDSIPALVSDGLGSDIPQALREALATNRLSAIVLVTDGQSTTSEDPVEVAKLAAEKGIPIYVIGVGDANPPKNLAVSKVITPKNAYPNEQFEVRAQVQALSLSEEDPLPPQLDLELFRTKVDPKTEKAIGQPVSVVKKRIEIPKGRRTFKVVFSETMNTLGSYKFSVRIPKLDNEIKVDDNQSEAKEVVVVEDKKYKVLLIAGLPSWDYQQVQRFLQRDQTVILSCWLQSMDESRVQEGNKPIGYLPRTLDELKKYNVVILMDPNPEEFDDNWMLMLREYCKKSGGVLFMAGPQFTTEFVTMNRLQTFREILPVRFGDLSSIGMSQDLAEAKGVGAGKMLVVPSKLDHPVMSFNAERDESAGVWGRLPNVLWNFPTLAAKPTAEVLLERGDNLNEEGNQPLLVSGRFGGGTVLYMGFQGTWRWRSIGLQAEYFDDFWMLVVRYLFKDNGQGDSRGMLESDKKEYELGNKIPLYLEILNEQFKGYTAPEITVQLTDDQGRIQEVVLQRDPGQDTPETNDGRYSGSFLATRLGTFKVSVDVGPESEKVVPPIFINIKTPSLEASRFWLNEKKLRNIATQSGGEYFTLDQIGKLPEVLPSNVKRVEFKSPPQPIWDLSELVRWLALLLPVVLLGVEWTLRKTNKLL